MTEIGRFATKSIILDDITLIVSLRFLLRQLVTACDSILLRMDFTATQDWDAHQQFQYAAFANLGGPKGPSIQRAGDRPFDVIDWHLKHSSCQHYFVNRAQLSGPVRTIAASVNIQLPF